MQANNGLQDHSGFAGEQAMNVNYGHPATLVQNNYSTAMGQPITYGNTQPQQQSLQGSPPIFGLQQVVNINGALYALPLRAPGQSQGMQNYQNAQSYQRTDQYYQYGQNYQHAQHHQRAQSHHGSPNNQISATNPAGYENAAGNDALNVNQFRPSTNYTPPASRASSSSPPQAANHRRAVNHPQAVYTQAVNTPTAINTSQAVDPPQTGSRDASSVEGGPAQPLPPSLGTEITDEFRGHIKDLLGEKATTFQARIRNKNDYVRYRQAAWEARLKGGNHKNKCDDYPKDEAGELKVIQRIFEAIINVDGEQDPATDTGDFANCLAVKVIQGLSEIDVELLAYDFMVSSTVATPF